MGIGEASSDLFGEEDEGEERNYWANFRPEASPEEAERERMEKARHVYNTFVEPVLPELEEDFTADAVMDEIRPPYSEDEIESALEYGVEEEGLEYDGEEDVFSSV